MVQGQDYSQLATVQPSRRIFPLFDPQWSGRVFSRGDVSHGRVQIVIRESVMDQIVAEARRASSREIGGVVVGGYHEYNGLEFVLIEGAIAARLAQSARLAVRFTHETWAALEKDRSARWAESRIVGWYHSHPQSGVYFSQRDVFVHQSCFSLPWQVGIVVDPRAGELGFFSWQGSQVEPTGYHYLTDRLVIEP